MSLRGSIAFYCLLLSLFLGGCGDGTAPITGTGELGRILPATLGRVVLGTPVAGVPVEFRAPDGRVLAVTVSDRFGMFGTDIELPAGSTVSAELSDGVVLRTELAVLPILSQGTGQEREIVLNVPNTLAAAFHLRHPELSLAESEQRVRRFLGIPDGYLLGALDDSRHSPFHHQVFLQEAAGNGGIAAFLEILLDEMETDQIRSFGIILSGVKFLGGCATDLGKDFIKGETVTGFGWASRALGINFPFPSNADLEKELEKISQQIQDLSNELETFEAQAEYTAAQNKLGNDVVTPSNTTANELATTISSSQLNPVTTWIDINSSNPLVAELSNAFSLFNARGGLDELVSYLLGTYSQAGADKRLERLLVALINPPFGIDSDLEVYNGYGAYSNTTLAQQQSMLTYYLQVLEQAAEIYAEQVHDVSDPDTLVANIRQGQTYLASLARVKKQVLQQLPDPLPSDQVFVDREWGLMWYIGNLGSHGSQVKHDDAKDYAKKFPGVGPYTDGWRLPTKEELGRLYARIEAGASKKSIPNDKRALVLERWGWDISYMNNNHRVWAEDDVARFSLDTGRHVNYEGSYRNDVILVRTYPRSNKAGFAESNPALVPPLSELSPTSLAIETVVTSPVSESGGPMLSLKCAAAFASISGGNFTIGGSSKSRTEATGITLNEIDVTDKVVWSSSDESMASVSNFEGSEGQLVWHAQLNGRPLTPVTVTAQLGSLTSTAAFAPPADLKPVLSSIQVFPFNVGFPQPTAATPVQQRFGAVLFYLDPVTGDSLVQSYRESNAPPITWSLSDRATGAPLVRTALDSGFEDGNLLVLTSTLSTPDMIVTATSGGVSGTAPIHAAVAP